MANRCELTPQSCRFEPGRVHEIKDNAMQLALCQYSKHCKLMGVRVFRWKAGC